MNVTEIFTLGYGDGGDSGDYGHHHSGKRYHKRHHKHRHGKGWYKRYRHGDWDKC